MTSATVETPMAGNVVALPAVKRAPRRKKLVVDEVAKRAVVAYLLSHVVATREEPPSDAFLLLVGPAGEGKSTLLREVCAEFGFPTETMALANCASPDEDGASAKVRAFLAVCAKKGAVGILEDAHLSLLPAAEATSPNGGPLIMGCLMEAADIRRDGRGETQPIILTCNKVEGLGEALTRAGRCRVVYMKSTWRLRRRQLLEALSGEGVAGWMAANFLSLRYPRRSVAFLHNVIGVARESRLLDALDRAGGNLETFKTLVAAEPARFSFARVREAARRAVANEKASKGGVV